MNAALHHPQTPQPNLQRIIAISFITHIVVLIALSLTLSNSIRVASTPAIQVKLVGVPQPAAPTKQQLHEEKIRTQDSAAPKEPPKEMKNIPDSKATTKMMKADQLTPEKVNPIESTKRPPVLDKNPLKKKIVKNDLDAKVVKNPEDFLKALEFVEDLEKKNALPTESTAPATADPAGEGPQLQLNLADSGAVNAIRQHIEKNWLIPPGLDTRGLAVTILVSVDMEGNLTALRITKSSGQTFFDNSLERAVRKSVPLPIPRDKYDKFRELELTFQPAP